MGALFAGLCRESNSDCKNMHGKTRVFLHFSALFPAIKNGSRNATKKKFKMLISKEKPILH